MHRFKQILQRCSHRTSHLHSFSYFTRQLWQHRARFVLDLPSWKDEKQGKKINVSLNSLSLMWLYIDNSYLFFIPLILHQLLEKMYSSLKRCFLSMCLLVLSACSAVGDWYHEECRSKFGVRGFDVITYQWLDCRFVKPLPQFIEVTFLQTSQRRFFAR